MINPKPDEADELVEEMTRWEDDGGGNVGPEYAWLPLTSDHNDQEFSHGDTESKKGQPRGPKSAKVVDLAKSKS